MSNDVFSKVEVPGLNDRERIVHFLIQMGADERLFNNPSPEIGKKIIDRVLWILRKNEIDIQSLRELTADQLKNRKEADNTYCDVQVNPKTKAVTLVEAHEGEKSTKEFKVDEHGNVIKQVRVTDEKKPEICTYSTTYDKNGIMMKHKFKLKTNGNGDITKVWTRDDTFPFVAHVHEKHRGNKKEYYIPLNLYEMHDITSSEKHRDDRGNPIKDRPIILKDFSQVRDYYTSNQGSIKAAFSCDYKSPESLAKYPYRKGLIAIAVEADILPREKLLEDSQ